MVRWKGSSLGAIVALNEALRVDPYNVAIRRTLAGYLLEAGAEDAAGEQIEAVHRLSPKSNIVIRLNVNAESR